MKECASTHSAAAASSACIDHMCQPCTAFMPDDNTTGESVKEGIRSNSGKEEYRHEDRVSAIDERGLTSKHRATITPGSGARNDHIGYMQTHCN